MSDTHFDAIIIGSGFGGSVMAYRLAEEGLRVCLLERGKAYPPNSFPRSPYRMKKNFWDPSAGLYGMFNVWSFKGSGTVVSSGLGGGSLVYANILIRKDEKWFVQEDLSKGGYEYWPVTRADLDPHYDQVEHMMNAQRYPFDHAPYSQTPKTRAMQEAAAKTGMEWGLPKIAISFRTKHVDQNNPEDPSNPPLVGEPVIEEPGRENLHGKTRNTCRLCGECDIGCNYGSKNTLDYNYLSAAKRHGADLRTLCEVKRIEPSADGGGYDVFYVQHDLAREGVKFDTGQLPLTRLTCKRLIIAAGTFGSPYLLMKNRAAFPRLSKRLGTRFSVNGDLISFLINSKQVRNGETVPRVLDPNFGPVITSYIRVGDALDGTGVPGRGFYVEDGGYPHFMAWMLEGVGGARGSVSRLVEFGKRSLGEFLGLFPNADFSSLVSDMFGDTLLSSTSLPLLTMGRDVPSGNMRLRGKYLDVDWNVKESQAYFDKVIETVERIAQALGAKRRSDLAYEFLRQEWGAHPLGGCPMGRNKDEGVVDTYCRVFDYPGLYIVDGSTMPGPVGPNPSLTIAATSNRAAEQIIKEWSDERRG